MKLIIGLGNPGQEYQNTRHNVGFMVIDNFLKNENPSWQTKFHALYTTLNINGEKVFFLKPQTYMNLSGNAVAAFMNYYKISPSDILVIEDDLDLNLGKYRLKTSSSSGGHNGLKSIIESIKTTSFARLKIGISHNKNYDTKDYVLGVFKKEELDILTNLYPTFNLIILDFLSKDITYLMNKYNHK